MEAENSKPQRIAKSLFRKAVNPEPVEKVKRRIVHWGLDNLYPQTLVGLRQDNPIHGGIINQKVTFISSAGTEIIGIEDTERMHEIIMNVVEDFETFNGYALIFKKSGNTWNAEHVDFESVRYVDTNNLFAISDDWSASTQSLEKTNYREIKDIKSVSLVGDNADTEVLFYSKIKPKQRKLSNGKLSLCYYPVPVYVGAIVSILAGIEQDYFTYSEAVNGYKGGTFLSMNNGQPETDEKADEIADKIKEEATDRDRQGGLIVGFADGTDNAATVLQLNGNDLDKRYMESNKEIRSKILVGHSAGSPTLFGVNSESLFGSNEEMETAFALFSNNYTPKRQKFISAGIEWAFSRLGNTSVKIGFKKYVLQLAPKVNPVEVPVQMSTEKIEASQVVRKLLLRELSRVGVEKSKCTVLQSRSFDMQATDEDFLSSFQKFADTSASQQLILKLINDGKSFSEISAELGKGSLYLSLELIKLNASGLLKGWKITDPSMINIEVRYSYEVKSGFGSPVIAGTREFCRDLISLDRLYTRAEIDVLSNEIGTDVWRFRGGWYHNPKTDVSTPSCRHEWKQNIVRL